MLRTTVQIIVTISIFTLFYISLAIRFPQDFKLCRLYDPEIDECLKVAIEESLPKLMKGVRGLGLYPIEPLKLFRVEVGQGTNAVRFTQKYNNLQISNVTKSIIHSVKSNFLAEHPTLELFTSIEQVTWQGNYAVEGRVYVFPISGNGSTTIIIKNLTQHFWVDAEHFNKTDGKTYIKVTKVKVESTVDGLDITLKNLFGGNNVALSNQINRILNDNWDFVYAEVKDSFEEIFEQVYLDYMNKIFTKIPLTELFLV